MNSLHCITFGRKLRTARMKARKSLPDCAYLLGIKPALLSDIERGRRPVTAQFIDTAATVLSVDPRPLKAAAGYDKTEKEGSD